MNGTGEWVFANVPESFPNCANGTDLPLTVLAPNGRIAERNGKIFTTRSGSWMGARG